MTPTAIEWEDGRKFSVNKVLNIINAPPVHVGAPPTKKYDVVVEGQRRTLYAEESSGRWFVERRVDKNNTVY